MKTTAIQSVMCRLKHIDSIVAHNQTLVTSGNNHKGHVVNSGHNHKCHVVNNGHNHKGHVVRNRFRLLECQTGQIQVGRHSNGSIIVAIGLVLLMITLSFSFP
jgi:hypothetical protein